MPRRTANAPGPTDRAVPVGTATEWREDGSRDSPSIHDRSRSTRPESSLGRFHGLVQTLADRELAVICPDLRGHGGSGPTADAGGRWSYDDLVDHDVPTLVAFARRRFPNLPVVALGHSLFGHVMIAHLARHNPHLVDGVALLACNIVSRAWRDAPFSSALASSLIGLMAAASLPFGRFPARLLRIGNQDEAMPYVLDFFRWIRLGDWVAQDGFVYTNGVQQIRVPVAAWVGAGDRILSTPAAADAFIKLVDPSKRVRVVGRNTGLSFDPGHMELATDLRCRPVWEEIAQFVLLAQRR